jgi:hypothetical protein
VITFQGNLGRVFYISVNWYFSAATTPNASYGFNGGTVTNGVFLFNLNGGQNSYDVDPIGATTAVWSTSTSGYVCSTTATGTVTINLGSPLPTNTGYALVDVIAVDVGSQYDWAGGDI